MDEYIKRKAAIAKMNYLFHRYAPSGMLTKKMRESLRAIPAADVVEVRHGLNNNTEYADCDQFVCSECGIELQDWRRVERDCDDGEEYYSEYVFRFCPNCGAKMDLEATT